MGSRCHNNQPRALAAKHRICDLVFAVSERMKVRGGEGDDDFGGHGHIGSERKSRSSSVSDNFQISIGVSDGGMVGEQRGERRGGGARMSRRHTLPHLGGHIASQPSIFDELEEGSGLESLVFTASDKSSSGSARVSRDLSMSPFSRIRNDLEAFVEESDGAIEARFLGDEKDGSGSRALFRSPLIGPSVKKEEEAGSSCRTVWVGCLDQEIGEDELREAFDPFGPILSVKLLDGYAFVRFEEAEQAGRAMGEMNGRVVGRTVVRTGPGRDDTLVRKPSMDFALSSSSQQQPSRSLWVGNIPSETDESALSRLFSPFGPIESIRLVPPKHCAFINFPTITQSIEAMAALGGGRMILNGDGVAKLGYAKNGSSTTGRRSSTGSMVMMPDDYSVSTSIESLRSIFGSIDLTNNQPIIPNVTKAGGGEDYCWPVPALPHPPFFGPDLTPTRIRDYRRHLESPTCKPSEFDLIAMEILPVAVAASTDPVGNVLVQKLIERGSDELKGIIISSLEPYLAAVGIHKNGTWVIQKLINWCSLPHQQAQIGEALRPHLLPLLQDQYGNYVIQCCLQFSHGHNQFIMDGLAAQCPAIAASRFGSRAMRSCLESPHTAPHQQQLVATALLRHAPALLVDPNGVIVMQWLLDSDLPQKHTILLPTLEALVQTIAGLRFASNLLTKLLTQNSEPEVRDRLLHIFNSHPTDPSSPMQAMLREPTCIQIISKVLQTVPSPHRTSFLEAVREAISAIQQSPIPPPPHITKLALELRETRRNSQGHFDLSHLIGPNQDHPDNQSPQPAIRMKADSALLVQQEQPQVIFGSQRRNNSRPENSIP